MFIQSAVVTKHMSIHTVLIFFNYWITTFACVIYYNMPLLLWICHYCFMYFWIQMTSVCCRFVPCCFSNLIHCTYYLFMYTGCLFSDPFVFLIILRLMNQSSWNFNQVSFVLWEREAKLPSFIQIDQQVAKKLAFKLWNMFF